MTGPWTDRGKLSSYREKRPYEAGSKGGIKVEKNKQRHGITGMIVAGGVIAGILMGVAGGITQQAGSGGGTKGPGTSVAYADVLPNGILPPPEYDGILPPPEYDGPTMEPTATPTRTP